MSSTPTAGALRAAAIIQARLNATLRLAGFIKSDPSLTVPGPFEMIARVGMAKDIDRETGAAELLAALKRLHEAYQILLSTAGGHELQGKESMGESESDEVLYAGELARAAIAKAEGGK